MIEKLKKVDDSEYPYLDDEGTSHRSKSDYLQQNCLNSCGCGDPNSAMKIVRDTLQYCIDWKDKKGVYIDWLVKNVFGGIEGAAYFVLYFLDHNGYTEHGSSVHGSWLTDKGEELLGDINWCLENEKDEEE